MSKDLGFEVKLDSNLGEVEKGLGNAVERALYVMGVNAVRGAVEAISEGETQAVDTGRLRASISFVTPTQKGDSGQPKPQNAEEGDELSGSSEPNSVYVGSNVNYAEYVHNGTSKMGARPFLRRGIDNTREDMKEQVEAVFKGEL